MAVDGKGISAIDLHLISLLHLTSVPKVERYIVETSTELLRIAVCMLTNSLAGDKGDEANCHPCGVNAYAYRMPC